MSAATVDQAPTEWTEAAERMKARLRDPALINAVVDKAILPALAANYTRSGLKRPTGRLYDGITRRGADGNYVRVSGSSLTVGVDYAVIPYARYALEGRGPVVAKRAKALRFVIDGKVMFRKRVGPAPPHPVYYLDGSQEQQVQAVIDEFVEGAGFTWSGG